MEIFIPEGSYTAVAIWFKVQAAVINPLKGGCYLDPQTNPTPSKKPDQLCVPLCSDSVFSYRRVSDSNGFALTSRSISQSLLMNHALCSEGMIYDESKCGKMRDWEALQKFPNMMRASRPSPSSSPLALRSRPSALRHELFVHRT